MFTRTSVLVSGACLVALAALLVGCLPATPGPLEVPVTVVVTATPPPETATPPPPEPPSPTPVPTAPPEPTAPPPTAAPTLEPEQLYEDRGSPVSLLASYYNAVNRREYARAWGYWGSPPNPSYEDFVQGYADTAAVLLVVRPPTVFEGAAGSVYAEVAVLLVATHVDGSRHAFVGCYATRQDNPFIEGAREGWWLHSAEVAPTPGDSTDATLLLGACAPPPPDAPAYEDRETPAALLASYFNAIDRGEYARAWGYWENPPNPSYEDFVQGYADTVAVLLAIRPPTFFEGAAGSVYVSVPTLLVATHADSSRHAFVGCYTARRSNPALDPAAQWSLFSATVAPALANATDLTLLLGACGAD
jgi:hypothetical protein